MAVADKLRKPASENNLKLLLSREEIEDIVDILGPKSVALASAVAQLMVTSPDHTAWKQSAFGVVCLVKDYSRKRYYILLVDLVKKKIPWEQEIYAGFEYLIPFRIFHTFEAQSSSFALKFAEDKEAESFGAAVQEKLAQIASNQAGQSKGNAGKQPVTFVQPNYHEASLSGNSGKQLVTLVQPNHLKVPLPAFKDVKIKRKNSKKYKLGPEDISLPTNFRHIKHLGLESGKVSGFMDFVHPAWKDFFQQANVTTEQLQDEKTRDFILGFLEQNGLNVAQPDFKRPVQDVPVVRCFPRSTPPPPPPPSSPPPPPPPTFSSTQIAGFGKPTIPPPNKGRLLKSVADITPPRPEPKLPPKFLPVCPPLPLNYPLANSNNNPQLATASAPPYGSLVPLSKSSNQSESSFFTSSESRNSKNLRAQLSNGERSLPDKCTFQNHYEAVLLAMKACELATPRDKQEMELLRHWISVWDVAPNSAKAAVYDRLTFYDQTVQSCQSGATRTRRPVVTKLNLPKDLSTI